MRLSLPQRDIYFEQLIYPNEPIYNIGAKVSIKGLLDRDAFQLAYISLIQQHDAYRCYLTGNLDTAEWMLTNEIRPLEFIDFSNKKNDQTQALDFMNLEFKKVFNIQEDKFLYRFILLKIREDFHYLFFVCHHIITDGWGTSLMFRRLICNYNEIIEYGRIQSQYPYSYEDFIIEDEKYSNSKDYQDDKLYWKEKFSLLPENLLSSLDPVLHVNVSSRKELIIERDTYNKLIVLASNMKSTTFHVILAILYTYFSKQYQTEYLSIGLPVLNRSGARQKKTVGLFMGINPLLISIDENETFNELVEKIKKQLKHDYRHQKLPLGELVKELSLFNQQRRLFNITLSYEKQDYSVNLLNTITKVIPLSHESERVALALYIREFDDADDVKIDFDYNINYFSKSGISRVVKHFETLLNAVLKAPQTRIKDLEYLTEGEKHQLLETFNDTKVSYPRDKTIIDLFEERVSEFPDHMAVEGTIASLTYSQLDKASDNVSSYLTGKYGMSNEPVGVLMERSPDLIVILLGILKSGKSYIPIDPALPADRINYIIKQSRTPLIITDSSSLANESPLIPLDQSSVVNAEVLLNYEQSSPDIKHKPRPSDTAYIIYTSGSTGNPKGVEIGHQALQNFCTSIHASPGIKGGDVLYSVTTYSFDISILEFFTPLISGATVFIAGKDTLKNVETLKEELDRVNPTILQATPSFYQMLFNNGWQGNKTLKVLCGGDSLNDSLAEKLVTHTKEVWNMYGPTETTIWSSMKRVEKASDAGNIGKPINNTQIYILDKHRKLLPQDAIGRIYIAGDGLAKGYYNNPELTAERFIANPFMEGTRMYDTGDLGRWLPDGDIEFLGRDDFQVKIRGYRIELGEIETHLSRYSSSIGQVVADARDVNGEKVLVAYYTSREKGGIDKADLRQYLQGKLPEYMVPGYFVELESIPLTPNGKTDRKALPGISGEDLIRREYVAPRNATETKLVEIWQEVLGIDRIGITDNFFELGGNSLSAGKITNIVSQKFNTDVSLSHIFQNNTIIDFSKVLREDIDQNNKIIKAQNKEYYLVTPDQYNIWMTTQLEEYSNAYNMYSVFKIEGNIDINLLEKSASKLIEKEEISRTNFIEKQGDVFQIINEPKYLYVDKFEAFSDDEITEIIKEYVTYKFNLETDSLIKCAVIQNEKKAGYLIFLTHHIIFDGASLEIFLNKLIDIYYNQKKISSQTLQFKDYSEWLCSSINKDNDNFWKLYLKDCSNLKLPLDNWHSHKGISKTKAYYFTSNRHTQLIELAKKSGTTNYTVILTCIAIVLSKIYEQENICIGTILNGRNNQYIDNMIGMFIKTLPYKLMINEKDTFSSLIQRSQENILYLEKNKNIPLNANLNSLTDYFVVYNHSNIAMDSTIRFNSFNLKRIPVYYTKSRYPIVFNFYENNGLKCEVEYDEYIGQNILDLIWEKMEILLELAINYPELHINQFDLITSEEIKRKNSIDISFDF